MASYEKTLRGEGAALVVEDLVRLVSERTGFSPEALVYEGKAHAERLKKEDRERLLDEALQKARLARGRGEDALTVSRHLTDTLASVKVQAVDVPPVFSVDRLDRESKDTAAGEVLGVGRPGPFRGLL